MKQVKKENSQSSYTSDCDSFQSKEKSDLYPTSLSSLNSDCQNSQNNLKKKSAKNAISQMKSNSVVESLLPYLESLKLLENQEKAKNLVQKTFEAVLNIDNLKSFESYFPENNIERVLSRVEGVMLRNFMKNKKNVKNRKKSRIMLTFKEKTNGLLGNDFHPENLENYEEEKHEKELMNQNKNSPFQKTFFKTKNNIEKQIQEEEFDSEKFKESFREQMRIKLESGGWLNKIVYFFWGKNKKKILHMKKKGSLKTEKV